MYTMNKLYLLLILGLMLTACKNDESTEAVPVIDKLELPEWASDAVIYEANIRQMTEEGTFNAFSEHIERIANIGIELVWLMPIHPISEKNRKARGDLFAEDIEDPEERKKYLGSPYSVANYRAVNPDYGTMDDFRNLLAKAHELGLKVIIDWVPNHTGWDNPWITEHPDWYTWDDEGNIIDPIDYNTGKSWGWTDVADLNYDNQEMRKEMIETMKWWVEDIGIDGFRVDVAHGVPEDFFRTLIPVLTDINPEIFMLAESDRPIDLNNQSFHMDYAWSLHHKLNEIAQGHARASDIDAWSQKDKEIFEHGIHMNFTSNHDENSWGGTVFERMGDAHKMMAVFTATFEGMPLLYSGQEEPMKKRLAFFTKDTIGFKDYAYQDFYTTLFKLKKNNKALWNGKYGGDLVKLLGHEDVYAFTRKKDGDSILVILNMSDKEQTVTIPVDVAMQDVFEGANVRWSKGDELSLSAWQYYVLAN